MTSLIYKKYAELIIKIGINLQEGQDVIITASTNSPKFVNAVVECAYKNGARSVTVDWSNEELTKLNYKYQDVEVMKDIPNWLESRWSYRADTLPCMIHIIDESPDFLEDIDIKKMTEVQVALMGKIKPYLNKRDNKYQWTIVGIPSVDWAKKIFPTLNERDAYKKLWELIIKVTRLDGENPVEDWKMHNENLHSQRDKLNNYNFNYLTYKSNNGTNLRIHLQKNHMWLSGSKPTIQGIEFNANMPTEEIFTMPAKYGTDGIVYSTKPLSYKGCLIENFSIEFENGKAIKVHAEKGQEVLEEMIKTDEGACYLGEVALVPYDSPINLTNTLFYNTLYDENASCHLALGKAYKSTIKGYENMSDKDFEEANYNDSINHVDFMIGSNDLEIIGTTFDGQEIVVFKDGNWAI